MLERDAQRDRAKSGAVFSSRVQTILNHQLARVGVSVMPCSLDAAAAAVGGLARARAVLAQVTRSAPQGCVGRSAPLVPRGTLLAVQRSSLTVVAILDCSVSIHSRQTEVCFWAQMFRPDRRFVFVTEDRDVYSSKHRSELGADCERRTTARRMLEAFTDGVYLAAPEELWHGDLVDLENRHAIPLFDQVGVEGHTEYCDCVRPLDDLVRDLVAWAVPPIEKKPPLRTGTGGSVPGLAASPSKEV